MYGYNGKTMIIDLTARRIYWEPLSEEILRSFIGGIGLGTYLLYRYCPTGIDPLDPENPLIFVTSPLVGSKLTTSSKFAVLSKSPLTGFIGDSLSSSHLATELKATGCDAIVIKGKSEHPTLLSITNDGADFLDASHLIGLSTFDTERAIKARMDRGTRVACIGPAGEKLVRYASIANDGGRHAGRTGPGAVMGSKNLKAIAVRGSASVTMHEPKVLRAIGKDLTRRSLGPATEKYRTLGTMANVSVFDRLGALPTRNFQQSTFDQADAISGEVFVQSHQIKTAHCANCTIGCEHILTTTDDGKRVEGRMEYESGFALGSLVGVGNPNAVLRASRICDELGMDTISAGGTIAWAMECFEQGLFNLKDTDGIDLRFGNEDALIPCLELIAHRRGIGDLLANGSRIASQVVGQGSEGWAMHVKGLEMPGYEPRSLKTMALGLAVSTRGACHNKSSSYEADFSSMVNRLEVDDKRGRITMEGETFAAVLDSLIWCKFLRRAFDDFYAESARIYTHITGWRTTKNDLIQAGERINNLKKLFNIREGWTRQDDVLPPRVLKETLSTGVVTGIRLSQDDLDQMIAGYYRVNGWTKDGMIPKSKLCELNLDTLISVSSPVESLN